VHPSGENERAGDDVPLVKERKGLMERDREERAGMGFMVWPGQHSFLSMDRKEGIGPSMVPPCLPKLLTTLKKDSQSLLSANKSRGFKTVTA